MTNFDMMIENIDDCIVGASCDTERARADLAKIRNKLMYYDMRKDIEDKENCICTAITNLMDAYGNENASIDRTITNVIRNLCSCLNSLENEREIEF